MAPGPARPRPPDRIASHCYAALRVRLAVFGVSGGTGLTAVARHLGMSKNAFEIQMLYGMADPIKEAIQSLGYRAAIVGDTPVSSASDDVEERDDVKLAPLFVRCELAWLAGVFALWTHRWWAVALTYYWGLTLTTQAILTPDLAAGFPDPAFIVFWTLHSMVVWAAVYLTWGLGLTPDWRSYRTTVAVTAAWAATHRPCPRSRRPWAPSTGDTRSAWPWRSPRRCRPGR